MFVMSDRWNHNLEIMLISHLHYQLSYKKQATFLCTKIWVGRPDIFKSSTIFPVCIGLLTAQVFRQYAYDIESGKISIPGVLIT